MPRRVPAVLSVAFALLVSGSGTAYALSYLTAAAVPPPLPSSMAVIGDSISQATDACCFFGNYPQYSWATGTAQHDLMVSHYERIQLANPRITGHAFNDAVAGATVGATYAQAGRAVQQRVQYVTILVGANDLCKRGGSPMTPTATFEARFSTTMLTLERGLPAGSHIFVSSIPNLYQLWKLRHTSLGARLVWEAGHVCPSMLSEANTEADRQLVVRQEAADNFFLAAVCERYSNCRWDGLATFNRVFQVSDVSSVDYFHPSRIGQGALASMTWAHSWWPSTK